MRGVGVLSTRDADRIADAAAHVEDHLFPPRRDRASLGGFRGDLYTARVTSGTPDGDGNYSAVITQWDGLAAAWVDYSAILLRPINGESLTSGVRYPASPGGQSGGTPLFMLASQTSAGVDLEESDGTPAYPSAATIFVNRTTGVGLNASTATIEGVPATTTQQGVVTTGLQSFGGLKGFADEAYVSYGLSGGVRYANFSLDCGTASPRPIARFSMIADNTATDYNQLIIGLCSGTIGSRATGTALAAVSCMQDDSAPSRKRVIGFLGGGAGIPLDLGITDSSGVAQYGLTGTYAGLQFTSGLLTGGSFSGGSGTVTSITAGTGLSGGTITTTGTIAIATGGVTTTLIADDNVTYGKMQEVTAARLLGNPSGATANPSEIPLGLGLEFRSSALATFLGLDSEEWTAAGDSTATITSTWATLTDDAGDPVAIQLPAAGTYLLTAHLCASLHISSGSDAWIAARLYDSDDSVTVANSETTIVRTKQTTSEVFGTATIHAPHTASNANTIIVQVKLDGVGLLAVTVGKIRSHADGRARIAHWRQA